MKKITIINLLIAGFLSGLLCAQNVTLEYSTYLGGSGSETGRAIGVDDTGAVYVMGYTSSPNFPVTNAFQSTRADTGSPYDICVTKFSPDGSNLVYSTYVGGDYYDYGYGLAVHTDKTVYVTGYTHSDDFPVTNAYQSTYQNNADAFVFRLSTAGSNLVYSTYLGGTGNDRGFALAVGYDGSAFVTGYTQSDNYPVTNAFQSARGGQYEAFVTRLSPEGSNLIYSTYLGGVLNEYAYGVAVNSDLSAFVTGSSNSDDFPTTNAFQASLYRPNIIDAFVTRFSADGTSLIYSTYLGGYGNDKGQAIVLDSNSTAYITGYTESTNFPTANAYQSALAGDEDVFVAAISSSGSNLLYGTYLGGSGEDDGYGIAVGNGGMVSVVGRTKSSNFPTAGACQTNRASSDDAFVSRLSTTSSKLIYSTYLGGDDIDYGYGIACDADGAAYVMGYTESYDFPVTNAFQSSYNGGSRDIFVSKLMLRYGESFDSPLATTLDYYDSRDSTPFINNYETYSGTNTLETGSDVVYSFTLGYSIEVTAALSGLGTNLDLFLCDDPTASNCVAHSTNTGTNDEQIIYNAVPGTYYVVVDGYDGAVGIYDLSITIPPPHVTVTTETVTVTHDVTVFTVSGTNNEHVVGTMRWTNDLNNASGTIDVTGLDFQISGIPLEVGVNDVSVSGTNAVGIISSDSVNITRGDPGTGIPILDITNSNETVTYDVALYTVAGTNDADVVGTMWWVNSLTGGNDTFPAALTWDTYVALDVGTNLITVYGSNLLDVVTHDSVEIVRNIPGTGLPKIDITDPAGSDVTVTYGVVSYALSGTNDADVVGTMWVSNAANGEAYSLDATPNWIAPSVTLIVGTNNITVGGTNLLDQTDSDSVKIVRSTKQSGDPDLIYYVATNGLNIAPFVNWMNAATTIPDAVDVASDGDSVLVSDGVYDGGGIVQSGQDYTNRVVIDKDIIVEGVNGPTNTFIVGASDNGSNGPLAVRCVWISDGLLTGFTITNGFTQTTGDWGSYQRGGGVFLNGGGTVSNCVISGCSAHVTGGGVDFHYGGFVVDCTIEGNTTTASYGGGGASLHNGALLERCILRNNSSIGAGGDGGGLFFYSGGIARNCLIEGNMATNCGGGIYVKSGANGSHIESCTIVSNTAEYGGGIFTYTGTNLNCIVYGNTATINSDNWRVEGGGTPEFSFSCITPTNGLPGGTGCITNDPLFVDTSTNNYRLLPASPCIDSGSAGASSSHDLDGTPRPLDGDTNGTAIVDMGCYEVLNVVADSDGDTMTDGWELDYSLDPTDPSDQSGNPDSDPHSNLQEFIADTNPTDSNSYFCVSSISNLPPITLYFKSSSKRLYSMIGCSNLVSGIWTNVFGAGLQMGIGGADSMQDTNVPAQGPYYRLKVQLP